MFLPPYINILGTEFFVSLSKTLPEDQAGESCQTDRTILINTDLSEDAVMETFYHEVVHTMLAHTGLTHLLEEKLEEAIAQGLGVALYSLIANNPDLPKGETHGD